MVEKLYLIGSRCNSVKRNAEYDAEETSVCTRLLLAKGIGREMQTDRRGAICV